MKKAQRFAVENPNSRNFKLDACAAKVERDVKLVENQRNVISRPCLKYRHTLTTPEAEIQRSRRLLEPENQIELTIGDLSFSEQQKEKHRTRNLKRYLRNSEQGLSVGDLSVATDEKDSIGEQVRRARAERDGLTVGDLSVGRQFTPQASVSESQQMAMDMMKKKRKAAEECWKIRKFIFEAELEKQVRRKVRKRSFKL